jgi:hypothetical protein
VLFIGETDQILNALYMYLYSCKWFTSALLNEECHFLGCGAAWVYINPQGTTFQEMALFIVTTMKTSNPV